MRALPIVVLAIGPERAVEVAPTQDQCPVEALGPDRLDHPFGMGVRVRSPDRRADHAHPFRAEYRVERPRELRVAVADEEPDRR